MLYKAFYATLGSDSEHVVCHLVTACGQPVVGTEIGSESGRCSALLSTLKEPLLKWPCGLLLQRLFLSIDRILKKLLSKS